MAAVRLLRLCSWKNCINLKSPFHLQPSVEISRSSFHSPSVLFVNAPVPNGLDNLAKAYGPAVRLLLLLYNLEPSAISASGPHGKLLKCDVINYITLNKLIPAISSVQPIEGPLMREFQRPKLAHIPVVRDSQKPKLAAAKSQTAYEDIPISNLRQSNAKRLSESKFNVPHSYSNVECNIDYLQKLIQSKKDNGIVVSTQDYIVKAVAVVLNNVPSVNVRWVNSAVEQLHRVDLSVSVQTNIAIVSEIIERAHIVAVEDISHKIKELVESAKGAEMKPDGNNNGLFTVLIQHEVCDVPYLTSVICPPQCAVLAVGSSKRILNENGNWNSRVSLTLSYDRRAIEDTSACEFLHQLASILENPAHGFIRFPFNDQLL